MRNERVVTVVLAYVIGFNTAFIAFELNDTDRKYAQPTPVVTAAKPHIATRTPQPTKRVVQVLEETEGLYALVGDQKQAISAKKTNDTIARDGSYVAIPTYTLSPDEQFVHYCEQQDTASDTCKHFVYNIKEHTVHRVMFDNKQLLSSAAQAGAVWTTEGVLVVNTYMSVNPESPWDVHTTTQTGIDERPVSQ